MDKVERTIISEINAHIKRCGGRYDLWYVGVSRDARDALFKDHRVNEKKDAWIYRKAPSSHSAIDAGCHFVSTLHTDGEVKAGDEATNMVYAYKKSVHTKP